MAILKTCWCGKTVRRGSFLSGFFTLGFYTVMVATGTFHLNTAAQSQAVLIFSLLMVMFAGLCVFSSALLLVGLCVDCRVMLLPWIFSVSMTTLLDVILSFYLLSEADGDPALLVFFVTDLIICALNIYCILCVISQYQEYLEGRGGVPCPSMQMPALLYQEDIRNPHLRASKATLQLSESTIFTSHGPTGDGSPSPPQVKHFNPSSFVGKEESVDRMKEISSATDSDSLAASELPYSWRRTFVVDYDRQRACRQVASWHEGILQCEKDRKQSEDHQCLGFIHAINSTEAEPLLNESGVRGSRLGRKRLYDTVISLDRLPDSALRHVSYMCKLTSSATCPNVLMSSSESDISPANSYKLNDSE